MFDTTTTRDRLRAVRIDFTDNDAAVVRIERYTHNGLVVMWHREMPCPLTFAPGTDDREYGVMHACIDGVIMHRIGSASMADVYRFERAGLEHDAELASRVWWATQMEGEWDHVHFVYKWYDHASGTYI